MSREIREAETRLARRWLAQHQRLIGALGKQTQRSPVIVERDPGDGLIIFQGMQESIDSMRG
jgi:hypothetical protein